MVEKILKLLAETAGVEYSLIKRDFHLKDDLFLDENDIEEVLIELEDYYDVEFEVDDTEFVYVEDIINFVKESV